MHAINEYICVVAKKKELLKNIKHGNEVKLPTYRFNKNRDVLDQSYKISLVMSTLFFFNKKIIPSDSSKMIN